MSTKCACNSCDLSKDSSEHFCVVHSSEIIYLTKYNSFQKLTSIDALNEMRRELGENFLKCTDKDLLLGVSIDDINLDPYRKELYELPCVYFVGVKMSDKKESFMKCNFINVDFNSITFRYMSLSVLLKQFNNIYFDYSTIKFYNFDINNDLVYHSNFNLTTLYYMLKDNGKLYIQLDSNIDKPLDNYNIVRNDYFDYNGNVLEKIERLKKIFLISGFNSILVDKNTINDPILKLIDIRYKYANKEGYMFDKVFVLTKRIIGKEFNYGIMLKRFHDNTKEKTGIVVCKEE